MAQANVVKMYAYVLICLCTVHPPMLFGIIYLHCLTTVSHLRGVVHFGQHSTLLEVDGCCQVLCYIQLSVIGMALSVTVSRQQVHAL